MRKLLAFLSILPLYGVALTTAQLEESSRWCEPFMPTINYTSSQVLNALQDLQTWLDGNRGALPVRFSSTDLSAAQLTAVRSAVSTAFPFSNAQVVVLVDSVARYNDNTPPPAAIPPASYGHTLVAGAVTWTNMPVAATEFGGTVYRTRLDLSGVAQIRLVTSVAVAGATNAVLRLQWSAIEPFADLTSNILTPDLAVSPAGTKATAWQAIPDSAKADVFLRAIGQAGDGAADPQFRKVEVQVR